MNRRYSYLFADVLTNKVVNELPCYGTSFSAQMSGTGNMTATIPLNAEGYSNKDTLNSTIPGKHALYAVCNDTILWGGPIWSRTYSTDVVGISLTGQTWESWPYKMFPTVTLVYQSMDQRNIARQLLLNMQTDPRTNPKFTIPPEFSNNIMRNEAFPISDMKSYGDLMQYMTEYDDGFDYTIECAFDSAGVIQRYVRLGNPLLGRPRSETNLMFEYPGSISKFYYSENASNSALRMHGIGAGEGTSMLRLSVDQTDLIAHGTYPLLQQVYTNKDVSNPATLKSQTTQAGAAARTPRISWSIEVDPTLDPVLGTWGLGDNMWLAITDEARFPDGVVEGSVRVVGWSLTPPSSSNKESLSLVLEGDDDAG